MELERREYEYIRKIAETGSFIAAAEKLYITQPSLSQFIRRIERHVGAELFDRSHQPVTLTEAGRIYLDIEGQIQDLCKVREQRIQDLGQTVGGTVRIGSSNYRSSTILARAIPIINERYPHIDICLEEGTTRELEDFAIQGKTDFLSSLSLQGIGTWIISNFSGKNCSWLSRRTGAWGGNRCMTRASTPAILSLIITASTAIPSWS